MLQKKNSFGYAKYGYLFSIPFVVVYCMFSLAPTLYTFILAFTDSSGVNMNNWNWLEDPFANFVSCFHNKTFMNSIVNTVRLWIWNFIPQITLALVLTAWFTGRRNQLKGQGLFKVIFYMPNIITAATVAILFQALFQYPEGPANGLLQDMGLIAKPFYFNNNPTATRLIVAFIQFWQWYGYTMIILISGVLGINPEIYEAAEIDGANDTQLFFHITIPNLRTILIYTLITSLIGGLNMYDIPKLYQNGGPAQATMTANVFIAGKVMGVKKDYGLAAAASMIMFFLIAVCSIFVFFIMRDKKEGSK